MLDAQLVQRIMAAVYDIKLTNAVSLSPYAFDWRGIYRVDGAGGERWVLRLRRDADAADDVAQTAAVLRWLAEVGYAAPVVQPDRLGAPVGRWGEWQALLLSYVPGQPLIPTAAELWLLGATLARLHALPLPDPTLLRRGRTAVAVITETTLPQLERFRARVPARYRPMAEQLFAATEALAAATAEPALTHGDCWYLNAIAAPDGAVVLIDWDAAGVGWPLLDLGNALLTSHYDLARPLHVAPDPAAIRMLVAGYTSARPIRGAERDLLLPAVRWLLAFQLADYVAHVPAMADDDLQLAKFQARFDATAAIAALAREALES